MLLKKNYIPIYLSGFKYLVTLLCMCCFACNAPDDSTSYVAFGDSHIARYDVNFFFSNSHVRNLGVSGLFISEIETELRSQDYSEERLILHAGTNDYIRAFNEGVSQQDFIDQVELDFQNLLSATDRFQEVLLIGVLPVTAEYFEETFYDLLQLDQIIGDQCAATPGCKYISSKLLWDETGFLDLNYSTDLIHLNYEGYQQLSAAIYHEMD